MKITRLHVENYKRISVAEILLDPDAAGTVALMGPNEAGKSSMLDAFEALIAGRNAPKRAMPIRRGAESAEIIAEFRDDDGSHIIVTRRYRANGTTTIEVREDGLRKAKPDAILSKLYSHVALDPLAFANLKPKEQVDTLVRLSGFDPSAIDEKTADVFATRTEVNSEVRRIEAGIDGVPNNSELQGRELVSVAALADELGTIRNRNATRHELATFRDQALREHTALQEQIDALEQRQREAADAHQRCVAELNELGDVEDVEQITAAIGSAEALNEQIRVQQARDAAVAKLEEQRGVAANLTRRLQDLAVQKREGFANADMPVPGLTIEGEQVLLDGTPFSETSAGRKLRTSAAIAMRLNPDLRAIVIRDGSLLDAENRRLVDELAVEHDFTVLMEIVDENAPTGVIFEDGTVAGTKGAAS